ncbi:hypothetical protein Cni_G21720 [Canna indica]|uniref:GATA-type domain-containing protein n=1 Tax=Canna indica TaxID=4628 RepID=A0AAQ3QHL0_9LILI|nr:hypothetical protein Cni_G21720 [Canna indica]
MATEKRMEDGGMGDLFDHIDDLINFPGDEEDDALLMVEPCVDRTGAFLLPPLPPPPPPPPAAVAALAAAVPGEDSLECSSNQKPRDELDIVELEWTSKFLDDSVSFFLDLPICDAIADNVDEEMPQTKAKGDVAFFRTSSPVSVLEANAKGGGNGDSSSSSSSSTSAPYFSRGNNERPLLPPPPSSPPHPPSIPVIPARARSKRRRPATFAPRPHVAVPYLPPSSHTTTPSIVATSDPESSGESFPPPPPPPPPKKIKISTNKSSAAAEEDEWGSPPPARKCMHCGIQKTPQWRAGPMGPKTLCNACGVRYKSGRLFPEYRPAASPTFVPSLHSNSHKKVVEMRLKSTDGAAAAVSSDGCDLLEYIRRRH